MDVGVFCKQSNVVVVVGKGGVGKTTVSAALALAAARAGIDVLVVALDDSGGLPALFGLDGQFGYEPVRLAEADQASIFGQVVTSREALLEYLAGHSLGRVSKRLVQSGALDVVATAIPGVEQVLVLGKVKQLERAERYGLIVVDAPATGHAVSFLTSSRGLVDAARGGPLRAQAEQVVELLADPKRCQALLVTLPEETPVNEVIETAYRLEDEVGIALGPVVVNACLPVLDGLEAEPVAAARAANARLPSASHAKLLALAAAFRIARQEVQAEQQTRLAAALPLAQVTLPYLFDQPVGPAGVGELAQRLAAGIEALPGPGGARL
jgi:anion-transporting  ArsA/GET3 family ATPase